ncbi:ABC transporter permease [Sphaerisporangium siamense]|uniref:Alpha-glucoside transport system permease protein n=1 Tax=Sphaerisporangium siamense TaxID=795645 RepID=A0A7W7DF22_9ACTN|nr:sugar ABC transporter permease [Sphaerisporangium siamense]MBB4705690.1 alpha-glucoside transport system permease protein [Sphaerisporangium siamense]GII82924.1 ABC transporter permease [Sphaerisporangium siamense]
MTERLDGPQTPRGDGDVARGASPGPDETPQPPPPASSGAGGDDATNTVPPAAPARTTRSGNLGPSPKVALAFLVPAFVILGAWVVYPIIYSIVRSLYDANGDGFVGLGNYASIFSDSGTLTTIRNNLIWVVVAPSLVTALGLLFAVLTERVRWATAFKLVVFMPMAVSLLASGVIFRLVYEQDPDRGAANAIITSVHDVFASSSGYPGARPRENDQAPAVLDKGAVVTRQQAQPGAQVTIPLVGLKAEALPAQAAAAKPATTAPGELAGTVWLDFTPGGGTANRIDGDEKGMPDVTVEAVSGGQVKATTTTAADGTFHFSELPAGSYQLRLPRENFAQPFAGATWLGPTLITPAIIGAFIWVWAGFAMVLIAAGLSAIPRDALEAARIDGATEWQVFRRITIPLLSPVLLVVLVTMIINTLKVFDLVFVIAPGSAQPQANVIALEMWRVSFGGGGNQGLGSALAIFLLVLVLPFMAINIRRFRREQA